MPDPLCGPANTLPLHQLAQHGEKSTDGPTMDRQKAAGLGKTFRSQGDPSLDLDKTLADFQSLKIEFPPLDNITLGAHGTPAQIINSETEGALSAHWQKARLAEQVNKQMENRENGAVDFVEETLPQFMKLPENDRLEIYQNALKTRIEHSRHQQWLGGSNIEKQYRQDLRTMSSPHELKILDKIVAKYAADGELPDDFSVDHLDEFLLGLYQSVRKPELQIQAKL